MILKLDFEKAFDTVEHNSILLVMQHMSFPDTWIHWIRLIFSSGTSAVLLIGVPGKKIVAKEVYEIVAKEVYDRVILSPRCCLS